MCVRSTKYLSISSFARPSPFQRGAHHNTTYSIYPYLGTMSEIQATATRKPTTRKYGEPAIVPCLVQSLGRSTCVSFHSLCIGKTTNNAPPVAHIATSRTYDNNRTCTFLGSAPPTPCPLRAVYPPSIRIREAISLKALSSPFAVQITAAPARVSWSQPLALAKCAFFLFWPACRRTAVVRAEKKEDK